MHPMRDDPYVCRGWPLLRKDTAMRDDLVQQVTQVIREQQGCFFDDIARHVFAAVAAAGFAIVPREPNEAMLDAGAIYADHNGAHGAWQAMIDCALKEDA